MSNSVKTAVYCDTTVAGCDQIWNLTGGVALAPGQTLVLTQTGLIPGVGGNFDTSDLASPTGTTVCSPGAPCTITVELNTGSGLAVVYGPNAANVPLNNFNSDPGGEAHQESSAYIQAASFSNFTLSFGYADNEHAEGAIPPPAACATTTAPTCFPSPFDGSGGTAVATRFIGAGIPTLGSFCTSNCYDAGVVLITAVALPPTVGGRMTGGGSIFTAAGARVTHGFELHCNIADVPNNLEINWDGGNNFHLTSLTSVTCIDDPAIAPPPPNAGFDTYIGTGVGTCNGLPATISFVLTDPGEPGTKDTAQYTIAGACSLTASGNLDKGNQQAHK
jgi:hypothetical protein